MQVITYIPCKSISRRVAGKNFKKYGNKPLFEYTLDFSLNLDTDILISSDINLETYSTAKVFFHLRENSLANPDLTNFEVMKDIFMDEKYHKYDYVLLLQPSHPLRRVQEILDAFQFVEKYQIEFPVISSNIEQNNFMFKKFELSQFKNENLGSFYIYPLNNLHKSINLENGYYSFFIHRDIEIDIDEMIDEDKFKAALENKEGLKEKGYCLE